MPRRHCDLDLATPHQTNRRSKATSSERETRTHRSRQARRGRQILLVYVDRGRMAVTDHPQVNRLGEYLRARRALVDPDEAGVYYFGRRYVSGLRRDELARLAGVSPAYYTRLEQGRDSHPSRSVLLALAGALNLDEAATDYLIRLGGHQPAPPSPRGETASPTLIRILTADLDAPGFIVGRCLDVLAANKLAESLHPSFQVGRNVLADAFLDPAAQDAYPELERVRDELTASLRTNLSSNNRDKIDVFAANLGSQSAEFERRWTRQDTRRKTTGTKAFLVPELGRFDLAYETLAVEGADHQLLVIYQAPADPAQAASFRSLRERVG